MLFTKFKGSIHKLGDPISVSRRIQLKPYSASGAFYLPKFETKSFQIGDFIGDLHENGSCRVDIHSYSPHNHTHIETPSHIVKNGMEVDSIPKSLLSGLVYLTDVSKINTKLITPDDLKIIPKYVTTLAIKSSISNLKENRNFTNTNPVALHPDTTKLLYNSGINTLILDMPSADEENDDGKLLAHRNFFGIAPGVNHGYFDEKIIMELAYFSSLKEDYYYFICTPIKITTDAIITDIWFYPIIDKE